MAWAVPPCPAIASAAIDAAIPARRGAARRVAASSRRVWRVQGVSKERLLVEADRAIAPPGWLCTPRGLLLSTAM
jgi:hypothetical protein